MHLGDKEVYSDRDKCELFADFFQSVYAYNDESQPNFELNALNFELFSCNTIYLRKYYVLRELMNLNVSKGPGPDKTPTQKRLKDKLKHLELSCLGFF